MNETIRDEYEKQTGKESDMYLGNGATWDYTEWLEKRIETNEASFLSFVRHKRMKGNWDSWCKEFK